MRTPMVLVLGLAAGQASAQTPPGEIDGTASLTPAPLLGVRSYPLELRELEFHRGLQPHQIKPLFQHSIVQPTLMESIKETLRSKVRLQVRHDGAAVQVRIPVGE